MLSVHAILYYITLHFIMHRRYESVLPFIIRNVKCNIGPGLSTCIILESTEGLGEAHIL